MLINAIDQRIRKAFSDSAMQYEALTGLQHEIGRDLVKRIPQEECDTILDVGMGTGRMTNRLSFFFPDTRVIGMDFAPGMVKAAKKKYNGFGMLLADALCLPFKPETFGVVVSNLVYQWAADLPGAFEQVHRVTKPGGAFCFTLFGPRTLEELFASLKAVFPSGNGEGWQRRFAGSAEVAAALRQCGFVDVETDYELIKINFENMFALLRWLKNIGANRPREHAFIGRDILRQADEHYRRHYRTRWGVSATFEVIWAKARKSKGTVDE